MHGQQFPLRSLFILTAIVVVGCLVGPWAAQRYREHQAERAARMIDVFINGAKSSGGPRGRLRPAALSGE